MRVPDRCVFLGVSEQASARDLAQVALRAGIAPSRLDELLHPLVRPLDHEVSKLSAAFSVPEAAVRLRFGAIDKQLGDQLARVANQVAALLPNASSERSHREARLPDFVTPLGRLYQDDCLNVLSNIADDSVDLVFADPPFNLKKVYESGIDDDLQETEYLAWCEDWLEECCRVLRPGGSLWVWNIPKWSTYLAEMLNARLNFRHWVAVDVKYSLPIAGRLYPSHYGLLYYVKGKKPSVFKPDRLPMATCPHCGEELKDYGGYKAKMNPAGINLADVWLDISPVRHSKYKKRKGANELPVRLLDRVIELATNEGDTVLDPFGGAGTTYAVAEIKGRRWIGAEIGSIDQIKDRFENLEEDKANLERIRANYNQLFPPAVHKLRKSRSLWTCEDFHPTQPQPESQTGLF